MSLSLINKTNVGKLFIANDTNYLVKEVVYVNDDLESITATLVNAIPCVHLLVSNLYCKYAVCIF